MQDMYLRPTKVTKSTFIMAGITIALVGWTVLVLYTFIDRFARSRPFTGSNSTDFHLDTKPAPASDPNDVFVYSFNENGILYETGDMSRSTSPYWWLDSGAILNISGNIGMTNHGDLPASNYWRIRYAESNPIDTDNGYHPQNIFRLVSRTTWHNVRQEMYFMVNADRLSQSPRRDESNGLLLFSRYRDSNNLYYAGLRVDGKAVIKKKIGGVYYTLALSEVVNVLMPSNQFANGFGAYDRASNQNLLPKHIWMGIRMDTLTRADGQVEMLLYTDIGRTGVWTLALSAIDNGRTLGGPVIDETSHVGVRTDFMDVAFSSYRAEEIK